MGRKKREIVWHKKRNKFLPSSSIKPHTSSGRDGSVPEPGTRRKVFAQGLLNKIRKAVRQSSDHSSS